MKFFPLAAVAAAAIALVVFVALSRPNAARSAAPSRGDSITVTGVGEATVAPDQSGFAASHDHVVLVRNLPKAGTIVGAAVASGADQVSGPTFSRSDKDALYREALRAALAQARAKAQSLAEASHVALGSVTKVEEQTDTGYVPFAGDQPMYRSAEAAAKTPIAKGRQKTEATVDVTFAIG